MKIGMIGTGGFSRKHATILTGMKDVSLQAVCGTSVEKAEAFARQFGTIKGYDNVIEMLDDKQLDAVYICVPPFAHGRLEEQLIARDIPFFVEKSLAVDLCTASNIKALLNEKNLITSVGYHFRYRDTVRLLKEALSVHTVGMAVGSWMGSMPLVDWWRDRNRSGGQFVEQTTHLMDLVRYTLGEVEEVYAMETDRLMAAAYDHVTAADVGSAMLKMKSGVIVQLSNTCMLPDGVSEIGLRFFYSGGIAGLDGSGLAICTTDGETKQKDKVDPYVRENEAFLHGVRTGDTSHILSCYEDAWYTQQTANAIGKSIQQKKPVRLGEE
ncbi:Gfo/Idh/MocA family protein [Domibacillus robiginosus]|uniref:Gfo/Idh/MocA family protein n=1 Tax=Domibacillus robiginosus TaxID=1071054 RepID=UPI000A8B88D6|nr:Gfo/Idh/MocA family oxidoreductase [Domibacillus robiginosus]